MKDIWIYLEIFPRQVFDQYDFKIALHFSKIKQYYFHKVDRLRLTVLNFSTSGLLNPRNGI